MAGFFERSLLLRIGLAMATITALAFVGMLSSVFIAEVTQGAATAVNQAGTLRMQSYRIAANLNRSDEMDSETFWRSTLDLVDEFEYRLNSPRLINAIPPDGDNVLRYTYNNINVQWLEKIKPLFITPANRALSAIGDDDIEVRNQARERYLTLVERFVEQIDHLVMLLENEAETNIRHLRLIQIITLFLTLGVVFGTMYLMHTDVLLPLRELLTSARYARKGNFSYRTPYTGNDELGNLGRAFNTMAEDLSKMYADLEYRVELKTQDLERSNCSLELLYKTTNRLINNPLSEETFSALLKEIEKLTGIGPGTICLDNKQNLPALRIASTRIPDPTLPDICSRTNCATCFGHGNTRIIDFPQNERQRLKLLSCPIRDQDNQYGVLLIELANVTNLEEWQTRLLEAVATHIASAIASQQQVTQSRRLALLEERSVIARELHDSLAQSLSYLKIQVSRLNVTLEERQGSHAITDVIHELRQGINSAYRQLRELLSTFRLNIDGKSLGTALQEAVDDIEKQGSLSVDLCDELPNNLLTVNEEIHVLQIVREGLSNVLRHADASQARVHLNQDTAHNVTVTIDDNGKGPFQVRQRTNHYGLAIMEERATSLGGEIVWEESNEGGTRVKLTFVPTNHSQHLKNRSNKGASDE